MGEGKKCYLEGKSIIKKTLSEIIDFSPTLKSSIIYACINIAMEMWSYPFQDVFAVK